MLGNVLFNNSIISVGIDVGTTSTHLVFSRLDLANESTSDRVPKITISSRSLLHAGDIYETPLVENIAIDAVAVRSIVEREYAHAGLTPAKIECGAAIITGETAMMRNAEAVIQELSSLSGDFVAASAGPHLESVLAGRGSGAADHSKRTGSTVCNIDIGGGTTNLAVFSGGELVDTACIGIGGRFLRINDCLQLLSMTDSGETFLDGVARRKKIGDQLDEDELRHLGFVLAEAMIQYLVSAKTPQIAERLLITDPLRFHYTIDEYCFSGGVAAMMADPASSPFRYGDMGGCLANGLRESIGERGIKFQIPKDPIRATVLGAGLYSMQLSGTTVAVDSSSLPLKNISIAHPFRSPLDEVTDLDHYVSESISEWLLRHDHDWSERPLAIALNTCACLDFSATDHLARALAKAFQDHNARQPLIVISTQDIGMAIGRLLRGYLPVSELVILDGLSTNGGDYIDIGKPLPSKSALPVVVKDLIFAK
jgi:ethanolamine utilization protein EutA